MTAAAGGAEGPVADPLRVLARIRTTRPRSLALRAATATIRFE